jgi:DNA polymerase III delta prime subunit
MSVNNLLLWEKYRPRKFEDIILPKRISDRFEKGISQHYILYGHHGTGKTSLTRILIGKYSKLTPYLELNCSLDTSIDVLRKEIDDFCKFTPMMDTDSDIKYVFLDEFDRVSKSFQDAFKAFIEKYNNKVRFIIGTNHINKISDELKSRVKSVSFDCQSIEEEKYLKQAIYKRVTDVILPSENKEIPKKDLIDIINKKFPDFRSIIVEVQDYLETGNVSNGSSNVSAKIKLDLYNVLYDTEISFEKVYHFLMSSFGAEKIDVMIKLLGIPFLEWSMKENKNIDKLFETSYVIADYTQKLETATDPIILGMAIIGKFRDILKNKV